MKLEKVLIQLRELFNEWGFGFKDWILAAQYAYILQGYDIKMRKGHFNILVDKTKLPWESGEALETHPPENTEISKRYHKFVKDTGFEFDISPVPSKDFKRKVKETVIYDLPGRDKILLQTPWGAIEELDKIFSLCTPEGWGEEKGARLFPFLEDQKEAALKKGEKDLARAYNELMRKYIHLKGKKVSKTPKDVRKIKELSGIPASKGQTKGKVRIVLDPSKIKDFKEGDILITSMTSPKFAPIIKKATAIVTDEGGMLCHAAIISRELGIPCIVGTKNATKVFKDNDLVELNAYDGIARILEKAK